MARCGLHKQDANRVLSPWQWIDAVVTGSESAWEAFFALRCHQLADHKIQRIAEMIRDGIQASKPRRLGWGDWHLPYYVGHVFCGSNWASAWASVGACARVSYSCFDGRQSDTQNMELGRRLTNENPAHASPLEHVLWASKIDNTQPGPVGGCWRSLRQIEGV
jgi:thymidylate synthase ThyX